MTSNVVSPRKKIEGDGRQLSPEQAAAAAMVAEAKARGLELTGPNGLLKLFTKNVLETALNEELTEHLGHERNQAGQDRGSTNVRNGTRSKTVVSDAAGEVSRPRLTQPALRRQPWRARCSETGTPGSAGGLGKRAVLLNGGAPQPDPTHLPRAPAHPRVGRGRGRRRRGPSR